MEESYPNRIIARYEQFLLFPKCFQKACFPEASKGVTVWEWVKSLPKNKILEITKFKAFAENKINVVHMMISVFNRSQNIVGKGENAGYQYFLLFPQCYQKFVFFLWSHSKLRLCGKKLTLYHTILTFFSILKKEAFETTVRKGENAGYQHFPPLLSVFCTIKERNWHFSNIQVVVCKCFQFGYAKDFVVW